MKKISIPSFETWQCFGFEFRESKYQVASICDENNFERVKSAMTKNILVRVNFRYLQKESRAATLKLRASKRYLIAEQVLYHWQNWTFKLKRSDF